MPKRILTGTVVSDKGDKTVVVNVERKVKHPLYGKIMRRTKKYHAHDENNEIKTGETVRIEETRPISKLKTWKVLERVGAAAGLATPTVKELTKNDPADDKIKAPEKPAAEPKAEEAAAEEKAES
ncbi:30S ribosomal protein S17 [Parasphingorhabdus halotolerans]|uniref:Small ribosomal subunit protein uS17 n=1 Tax=Parasphingorhabdus halotolerans TaxID=2725558 RepID=A0A6H2DLF6_9SPHN|nr:30S ribosomal protein S17 [Parasphingorhabdus halotolerans]